jgi:hypothetical protein
MLPFCTLYRRGELFGISDREFCLLKPLIVLQ